MKRARNRAVQTKEGEKMERKRKNVFSTRRPLRRSVVCEISLPTPLLSSLPPRWGLHWVG